MKKKLFGKLSVTLAISVLLAGCGAARDDKSSVADVSKPVSQVTSTDDTSEGTSSDVVTEEEPFAFEDGSTQLSMQNGELNIIRRKRAEERSMGGDDWTILVYLCGTDLESRSNAATIDIIEAIGGKYSDNVNIVYQTGGTQSWYEGIISSDRIQRYELIQGDIMLVDEQPLANMGDPDTLSEFISWGAENYPAENMGLVMWNHGGGSISGICFDELHNNDSLSLKELDKALSDSYDSMTEKFEFIGFDACLMGTLETANVLVPYANYMYGSQETEPGGGWNYTAIMDYLTENPDADGEELGRELCKTYYDHCAEYNSESESTLSVIDLSKIDALLASFNETSRQIYESEYFTDIVKGILAADNFGGNNRSEGYTNMVDLGGILEGVSAYCPNAKDTLDKLSDAVVYNKNGRVHRDASGLSVYYPLSVQGSKELSVFADVCPSTYYLAFVDKAAYGTTGYDVSTYDNTDLIGDFADIWNIDFDYGDYSCNTDSFDSVGDSTIPVDSVYFDDDGTYTVGISDFTNLNYAACSVFLADADGGVLYLGADDEVYYDLDNGTITDAFDGSWICLPDGQVLPIEIVSQTEDYSIYTCSILLNGEFTNLRIEYDWNYSCWNVMGVWDGISEDGMAGRDTTELQNGDVIQPVYYYCGSDLTEEYLCGDEYVINGDIELAYQYLPAADYIYSITLYDIYGNWYFTPSVTFTVDENGELWFYPDELETGLDDYFDDIFGYYYSDYEDWF